MVLRFATVFIPLIAGILLAVSSRVIDKCSDCLPQNQKAVSYPEILRGNDKKLESTIWGSGKVMSSFEYPKKKVKRTAGEEPPGSSASEPVSDSSSSTSSESSLLTSITPNSTSLNTISKNTTEGLTTGTKETSKISTEEFVSITASSEATTKVSVSVSAAKNTTEPPIDAAATLKNSTDEFASVTASSEPITKAPDSDFTIKNETEASVDATATTKNTKPALNGITTNTVPEVYTAGITTISSAPPNVTTSESFPITTSHEATTFLSSKETSKSGIHWSTTSKIVPTTILSTTTPKIIAADTSSTTTISTRETAEENKIPPETTTTDYVDSEEYDEIDELLNNILTNHQELNELEKNLQEISDLLTCIIHQFLRGISGSSGRLKNCLNSTNIFNSSTSTQDIINGLIKFISDDSDSDFLL